jgi:imidazole glycerol-phosphate synthase subunit HisH
MARSTPHIQIIDLGISNLASLTNSLEKLGANWTTVTEAKYVGVDCDAIILPGVGAYSVGMHILNKSGIGEKLIAIAKEGKIFILGICLGMQLLFDGSDEFGSHPGLGIISGWVKKIETSNNDFRVPHIGWHKINWTSESKVLSNPKSKGVFYFIHSYWCDCTDSTAISATIDVGYEMTVAVESGKTLGVQFHPEKSLDDGFEILSRYLDALISKNNN